MSARIFAIIGAVGCVILAAGLFFQWSRSAVVERELGIEKVTAAVERGVRADLEKRTAGLEAEVNVLKASIESMRVEALKTSASAHSEEPKSPAVRLVIDGKGVITLGAVALTTSELTERLKTFGSPEKARVIIAVDEAATHQMVLSVLDAVKAAKIETVGFETTSISK